MINRTPFIKLKKLNDLINAQDTGSPKEIASKLEVSERQVYKYLKTLKDLEAPIKYDQSRKTYYYEDGNTFLLLEFVKSSAPPDTLHFIEDTKK